MTEEADIRSTVKAQIMTLYRCSAGEKGPLPTIDESRAFAESVLDIPQIAGALAGQELDDDWGHYYRDLEARQIEARLARVQGAVFPLDPIG